MTRKEELTASGWQRQATYDEPRLSEMVGMYQELGLEVHLETFDPEAEADCTDCTECMKVAPENYKTIYTRRKDPA